MPAHGDGLGQDLVDDLVEAEVDVVTGDVELDSRDLARRDVLVHVADEPAELLGGEAAERDDPVEAARARVVLPEVGLDADVRPAEGVHPAGVDLPECARVTA